MTADDAGQEVCCIDGDRKTPGSNVFAEFFSMVWDWAVGSRSVSADKFSNGILSTATVEGRGASNLPLNLRRRYCRIKSDKLRAETTAMAPQTLPTMTVVLGFLLEGSAWVVVDAGA